MITIKQIAQMAGVSPTTVSNVLHGNTARVSPAVLEKVQLIIKDVNYAPNMGAIILARNNSRIIGVIMFQEPRSDETVIEDPFSSAIIGTLEQEIRKNGYFMMLYTTNDKDEVLRLSATWKLDGLILLWAPGETSSIIKKRSNTPVVFIDCYFNDDGQTYYNIGLDDTKGGYIMTKYLLSLGHTKIAFLANISEFPSSDHARFDGCRKAFSEKNLSLKDDCFIPVPKVYKKRIELYLHIITKPFPFTALFFSADYFAAEAINYFYEHDVDVPHQISVSGFDDNYYSRLIRPHITTVHQDVFLKGQSAVSMLMQLIRKETVDKVDLKLPVHLKIRDSVQKPLCP